MVIDDDNDRGELNLIYKKHRAKQFSEMSEEEFEDAYEAEQDRLFSDAFDICENPPEPWLEEEQDEDPPFYRCKYCGDYTEREDDQQVMPADYCHPEDHML